MRPFLCRRGYDEEAALHPLVGEHKRERDDGHLLQQDAAWLGAFVRRLAFEHILSHVLERSG